MPALPVLTGDVAVADAPADRLWIVRLFGLNFRWTLTEPTTVNEESSGLAVHKASLWLCRVGALNVSVPLVYTDLLEYDPEEEKERARGARRGVFKRWVWYCASLIVIALGIVAVVLSANKIPSAGSYSIFCGSTTCIEAVRHSWWWTEVDISENWWSSSRGAHDVFLFEHKPEREVLEPVNMSIPVRWSQNSLPHLKFYLSQGDSISIRADFGDSGSIKNRSLIVVSNGDRRPYDQQNLTRLALEDKDYNITVPKPKWGWADDEPQGVSLRFYVDENHANGSWPGMGRWPTPVPLNWTISITGHSWEIDFSKGSTCHPTSRACTLKHTSVFRPFHGYAVFQATDDYRRDGNFYSDVNFKFKPRILAYTLLYGTPALLMLVSVIVFLFVLITRRTPVQWWRGEGVGVKEEGSAEEEEAMLGGEENEDGREGEASLGGEAGL